MTNIDLSQNIKAHLLSKYEWYEAKLLQQLQAQGYASLTPSQVRVFGRLKGEPKNISDLAKVLQVSRQAAHKSVGGLVELGLLELTLCTDNKSAKVVNITREGHKMRKIAGKIMADIEAGIAAKVGEREYQILKKVLSTPWD